MLYVENQALFSQKYGVLFCENPAHFMLLKSAIPKLCKPGALMALSLQRRNCLLFGLASPTVASLLSNLAGTAASR
jgi:hypothetical protein